MAVAFCKQLGAKELILTHFSQCYKRSGDILEPGEDSVDKLVTEAEEAIRGQSGHGSTVTGAGNESNDFSCTVSVADDFKTYTIPARK